MSLTPTPPASVSRSSSASSHSSTPTPPSPSSLKHPLPSRPLPDNLSPSDPFTPIHPSITLMTPTPPPSTSRPLPDSPSDKINRKWRASPLTAELTNVSSNSSSNNNNGSPSSPLNTSPLAAQVSLPPAPSAVTAACSSNTPNPLQTTNVYINGLPPNFKAEQLYALASQFGTVLSCRTFTRQLSDHPSGYGFVLFETLQSAQQCIDVLRSHHNLHPTFAKQAHKINRVPGGNHSTYVPNHDAASRPKLDLNMTADDGGADIYIEGLPMNVDVQTLRALLAPHTVRSSRLFADTRMQPPQLVAFIQLESRAAALDIREKLHGRAIRGYSARLDVTLADDLESPRHADITITDANVHAIHDSGNSNGLDASKLAPGVTTGMYYDPFCDVVNSEAVGSDLGMGLRIRRSALERELEQKRDQLGVGIGTGLRGLPTANSNGGMNRPLRSSLQSIPTSQQNQRLSGLPMPMAGSQQQQLSGLPIPASQHHLAGQSLGMGMSMPMPMSPAIPTPLQPISATLQELQLQLESLRPLLAAYHQSDVVGGGGGLSGGAGISNTMGGTTMTNMAGGTTVTNSSVGRTTVQRPRSLSVFSGDGFSGGDSAASLNPLAQTYVRSTNVGGVDGGGLTGTVTGNNAATNNTGMGIASSPASKSITAGHGTAATTSATTMVCDAGFSGVSSHGSLSPAAAATMSNSGFNTNRGPTGNGSLSLPIGAHSRAHTTTGHGLGGGTGAGAHGLGAPLFPHPTQRQLHATGSGSSANGNTPTSSSSSTSSSPTSSGSLL